MKNRTLITASGWIVAGIFGIALRNVTKENKSLVTLMRDNDQIIRTAQRIVVNQAFSEIMKSNGM